jgi:hypothetical protein
VNGSQLEQGCGYVLFRVMMLARVATIAHLATSDVTVAIAGGGLDTWVALSGTKPEVLPTDEVDMRLT